MNAGFALDRACHAQLAAANLYIKIKWLLPICWRCGLPGKQRRGCDIIWARPASPVDSYLFGKPYDS